jgi:hypothetical protein
MYRKDGGLRQHTVWSVNKEKNGRYKTIMEDRAKTTRLEKNMADIDHTFNVERIKQGLEIKHGG